jgi:hypothetical protein
MSAFLAQAFELGVVLFLGDELPALLASLCEVFFCHNLRLELRTLTDGPFAVPVSGWRVCSHDGPLSRLTCVAVNWCRNVPYFRLFIHERALAGVANATRLKRAHAAVTRFGVPCLR